MYKLIFLIGLLFTMACTNLTDVSDVEFEGTDRSIAFPILNSNLTMVDLGNTINEKTYIEVKPDGKLVIHYDGEVNRKDANSVFPTFPILDPQFQPIFWPMPDTNYQLSLKLITSIFDEDGTIIVTKSEYRNNNLIFDFTSQFNESIEVTITMPGMIKDNVPFKTVVTVPALANGFRTDKISLAGWTLEAYNHIPFVYDARKSNGERVIFEKVLVNMDKFDVKNVEGYFGQNSFDLKADEIEIGIFKKWRSGGFSFEDPIVTLEVDNSFGFPVKAKIKYFNLTTLNNNDFELQSELIDQGLFFNYPTLEERGQIINTFFTFDKNNSNVKNLFDDKVIRFAYDIDASINPHGDTTLIGFIDETSFFQVNASVILPIEMKINDLVLVDTFNLDLKNEDIEEVSGQFKLINQNKLPFDILLQVYFIDQDNIAIDSIFEVNPLFMEAASIVNGTITPSDEIVNFIDVNKEKYNKLKEATKAVIEVQMSTNQVTNEAVWIEEEHGILTKLGLILDIVTK